MNALKRPGDGGRRGCVGDPRLEAERHCEDVAASPPKTFRTSFVGLDSDGCVVDTMAAKQHGFLQPMLVEALGLGPMREAYIACADFVNLYSQYRGITRFRAILLSLTFFNRHPAVRAAGFPPVPLADLAAFVESGLPQSSEALENWLRKHPSAFLGKLLRWSRDVNAAILASGVVFPAYNGAREALLRMRGQSETGIVSQSPERVLRQDWDAHGLLSLVDRVAGQELGGKVAQLTALTDGRHPRDRVLMVGDAFGDLKAARAFGCRFFPILPGREEASWERFNAEVYPAFAKGCYTLEREAALVAEFSAALPTLPPWERRADSP